MRKPSGTRRLFYFRRGVLDSSSRAAAIHGRLDHDGGAMTLLQLGQIAAKYETEMAHAMLFAVAVAKCYGGGRWIKDIA